MSLEHIGIFLGFFGAVFQAFNYAFTKDCAEKYKLRGLRQLVCVHLGLFVLVIFPFFYFNLIEHISWELVFDTLWASVPYLVAQYLTIITLTMTDSSIFSPLLAIKIPVLAVIALLFLDQVFAINQIIAIGAIILLGVYFSSISGKIKLIPLILITVICFMYAVSDLGMAEFMRDWPENNRAMAICGCICYQFIFCGVIAMPFMKIPRFHLQLSNVYQAKYIALAWMTSDIFFVICFNFAGVVETSIVQSLRSVLGVIIAYIFYKKYIHDENTFRRKMIVAVLMIIFVITFYL